jgi:hypothetical protein
MAPENRDHHVDPGETAVVAHRPCDSISSSGLPDAAANLNAAPELFSRTHGPRAHRSVRRDGRRGCHLPSDTAPIADAGLQQLGDGSLIGLEQFIRPRQTLKPFVQRLELLIMRLDFLLDRAAISSRSRFLKVSTEFILTMVPEGPARLVRNVLLPRGRIRVMTVPADSMARSGRPKRL